MILPLRSFSIQMEKPGMMGGWIMGLRGQVDQEEESKDFRREGFSRVLLS